MRSISLSLFLIAVAAIVRADTQVLPSNNSYDLGSSYFRIWGSSHLDDQRLAPLTQSLLQLTDAQQKVLLNCNFSFITPAKFR